MMYVWKFSWDAEHVHLQELPGLEAGAVDVWLVWLRTFSMLQAFG